LVSGILFSWSNAIDSKEPYDLGVKKQLLVCAIKLFKATLLLLFGLGFKYLSLVMPPPYQGYNGFINGTYEVMLASLPVFSVMFIFLGFFTVAVTYQVLYAILIKH
jgi:hypothetical protein